jgi:hypothetical protein
VFFVFVGALHFFFMDAHNSAARLPFRVCCCSSELDHQPSLELQLSAFRENANIIRGGGWCSGEFPTYPIELGIYVGNQTMYIDKISFTVHRYKIPSKCEIFYGCYTPPLAERYNGDTSSPDPLKDIDEGEMIGNERAYMRAAFTRLGFVSFSDKSDVGFSSQEIKNVQINQRVRGKFVFLKVLFHQAHVNTANSYQQVSILNLDVRGSKDDDGQVLLGRPSDNADLSLVEQVNKFAISSFSTDDVDDILREFGLHNADPKTQMLLRSGGAKNNTVAAEGERLLKEAVKITERKMRQAAERDQLANAKMLKNVKIAAMECLDRTVRLSNRMRQRAQDDDYHGASSDLKEVKKQFDVSAKMLVESGITANDKHLLKISSALKAISGGARPLSPSERVPGGRPKKLTALPDKATVSMINEVVHGRKVLAYKDKFKAATIMSKVAERLTKIASDLPVMEERRDSAMLAGDYPLAVATKAEIDRLLRWRDELYKNSGSLMGSIDFNKAGREKQAADLNEEVDDRNLFLQPPPFQNLTEEHDKIKHAREFGLIVDGIEDYNGIVDRRDIAGEPGLTANALAGWEAQGSSKWLLATQIKMILCTHYYYNLNKPESSDEDTDDEDERGEEPPESAGPPKRSKFKCSARSTLCDLANASKYAVPGKRGVACPTSELASRDSTGMFQICFGIPAARCFYSRHPALRSAAIRGLESCLLDFCSPETGMKFSTLWKAVLSCCIECILDQHVQVMGAGFHLLRTAFANAKGYFKDALTSTTKREMACISVQQAVFTLPTELVTVRDLIAGLAYILPTVCKRAGERSYSPTSKREGGNSEVEMLCEHFVVWLGAQDHLGPTPVVGQLTKNLSRVKEDSSVDLAMGRLRLLRKLFDTFGTIQTGGVESALSFVCGRYGMMSPIHGVMMEAVDTVCVLYRHTGRKLEPYLKNLGGALQRLLQEAFAEVDVEMLSNMKTIMDEQDTAGSAKKDATYKLSQLHRQAIPNHVPDYDMFYCKCSDIVKADWVPWRIHLHDKFNVQASMLSSLGVPLDEEDIFDQELGLDEEDMEEGMDEASGVQSKIKEQIEDVENPDVIRRENVVVYDALRRGACTHPGCDCPEFRFGVRERRICRNCKHKNKFHRPPKAAIGLKPTKARSKESTDSNSVDGEEGKSAYNRRGRNRGKRDRTKLDNEKKKPKRQEGKSMNAKTVREEHVDIVNEDATVEEAEAQDPLVKEGKRDRTKLDSEKKNPKRQEGKSMNAKTVREEHVDKVNEDVTVEEAEAQNPLVKADVEDETAGGVPMPSVGASDDLGSRKVATSTPSGNTVSDRLEKKRLRQLERAKRQQELGIAQDSKKGTLARGEKKKEKRQSGNSRRRRKPRV